MKIFQIVNGKCHWHTPFESLDDIVGRFPKSCIFVEAPDNVFEGWGYRDKDNEGNEITGDDRFIKPVAPEGFIYDDDTGLMTPESEVPVILEQAKLAKQEENKAKFAEFLSNHPLLFTDGKYYGVTMEDQSEISLNLSQYQLQVSAGVENPTLEWHAIKEACQPWTLEDLSSLAIAISNYIYPYFNKMQSYKTEIFASKTKSEVLAIDLVYKTDEELKSEEI